MFRFTEGTRTVSLFLGLLILLASCIGRQGQLKPLDSGVESTLELIDQPQLATFSELQTNPEIYQDQLIGVTGLYFRLSPPQCIPFNGPGAKWALISEDLRLDAVGFDQVTRLLPQDTLMTVEGFFRLYEGPIGCGKAAPKGTAWYLEVIKIIQPNPISGVIAGGFSGLYPRETPLPIAPGQTLEPSALTKTPENPNSTPLPDATTSPGVTITPTAITTIIPTATGTPTPTVFGTISTTASPTATSSTLTPAPTNTPTRTPIGTPTPLQATPTSAYPGPLPPTATPTTGAYPPPTSTVSSYPS